MSTCYTNAKQLEGKTLKAGDEVIFPINPNNVHTVRVFNEIRFPYHPLFLILDADNYFSVFHDLDMYDEKEAFASKYFGHGKIDFGWFTSDPKTLPNNFIGLTKLVLALFKLCEKMPERKTVKDWAAIKKHMINAQEIDQTEMLTEKAYISAAKTWLQMRAISANYQFKF